MKASTLESCPDPEVTVLKEKKRKNNKSKDYSRNVYKSPLLPLPPYLWRLPEIVPVFKMHCSIY